MNCFGSTIKYILYIFNLIFLICGILLITLGAIMLGNMGDFRNFTLETDVKTIPIIIICLGCVIFLISFFGCCGAIRENVCCTSLYSVCMFILFVLQVALCVWIFVKRDEFLDLMNDVVQKAFNENNKDHGYPMDVLQLTFNCCGVNSYKDYNGNVPKSCCGFHPSEGRICELITYQTRPGCAKEFGNFWKTNINIIGYGSIGVAIVELVAFTFSCCLINSIKSSRRSNLSS